MEALVPPHPSPPDLPETLADYVPDHCHRQVRVAGPADVWMARHAGSLLCRGTSLKPKQHEHVALIITELATNLLRHAQGGTLLLRRLDGRTGVECLCIDRGPGIADLGAALRDGQSGGAGRGVGLGAVRRLSSVFDIHSDPALGTAVLSRVHGSDAAAPASERKFGAVMLPMAGMEHCGDGWAVAQDGTVALIDGLGHGPEASLASRRAELSMTGAQTDPARVIDGMHEALRGTRGAVVMVAHVADGRIHFAGVGNIAGAVIGIDRLTRLHSSWGVVGGRIGAPATHSVPWSPGDTLLLHSDGISRAVEAFAAAHLRYTDPTLASAIIWRDATTKLDDQTILVVR